MARKLWNKSSSSEAGIPSVIVCFLSFQVLCLHFNLILFLFLVALGLVPSCPLHVCLQRPCYIFKASFPIHGVFMGGTTLLPYPQCLLHSKCHTVSVKLGGEGGSLHCLLYFCPSTGVWCMWWKPIWIGSCNRCICFPVLLGESCCPIISPFLHFCTLSEL